MGKALPLPALLAFVVVAEEGLRRTLSLVLRRRRQAKGQGGAQGTTQQYGGLESLVSFSACLIAANRAVETEQPEPYIVDPLAAGLCGREALEARRARDRPTERPSDAASTAAPPAGEQPAGTQPQPQPQLQRPIPRLIMRTKFFDDVVTAVTWRGAGAGAEPASRGCHAQLAATAASGAAGTCLQVVLLGSGLDARPWRLPLPPGVRWFEVDRRDVLAAKQARLRDLGAQTDAATAATGADHSSSSSGGSGSGSGSAAASAASGGGWRHPLRAAGWSCVAVDLQRRGWARGLLERGLDAASPVLWVLEGLLYYLEEADVRALLQEAASVSGPGSILAASVIRAPVEQNGTSTADGRAGLAPPRAPAASPANGEQGARDNGNGNGGAAGEGRASYKLNSEFKWKCREEIPKFFGDCGWRTLASLSWLDAAKSYGFPTAETTASSVFFVTTALA
ncbi:hypothetical protein PLESTM_001099500 [Pleodorina starrii]|nr:hypothetical protein PLESTM_001099500 [Pleodorina starrii]